MSLRYTRLQIYKLSNLQRRKHTCGYKNVSWIQKTQSCLGFKAWFVATWESKTTAFMSTCSISIITSGIGIWIGAAIAVGAGAGIVVGAGISVSVGAFLF